LSTDLGEYHNSSKSPMCWLGTEDRFTLVRASVADGRAVMVYEAGYDMENATREILNTVLDG